jgi:uncharacterized protein (DUF1697 family)
VDTFIALLRAVNVGGRKLAMADLRRLVEEVGGRDVRTYLQSGNAVFTASARNAARLERAISSSCGFEVRVLLRGPEDLAAVIDGQPMKGPATSWHVTFLDAPPPREAAAGVEAASYDGDTCRVVGREVYLRAPDGYGRSKLTNAFFERKLGVAATTRNWRTVNALAELTRAG